ncbi:MAG: diguanylate cyclase [Pseudomonadota bacterium]
MYLKSFKFSALNLLLPAITVMCSFSLLMYLINLQHQKYEAEQALESSVYGNLLWTKVDRELNATLFISQGMASYIAAYKDEIKPAKIKLILKDLWQTSKHVRNLGLAVGYKLTFVYPEEGNSRVIGIDFRDLPLQYPQVKKAIETRSGVFDGPIELLQGGQGFVYRYPIFIEGEYWGILSTVINTQDFLKAAFEKTPRSHDFAIRSFDSKKVFYGDEILFADEKNYFQTSIVPNGKWEWVIKNNPKGFWNQIIIYQMLAFLFSLVFGMAVYLLIKERQKLTQDAMRDSLTQLPNRRLLQERMEVAANSSNRLRKMMAILAIDIDYFKTINDTYGHDFGDEVLKIVAVAIRTTLRETDTVSRIGGDEFIAVLNEIKSIESVHSVAKKLQLMFANPYLVLNKEITIHLSIGISILYPGAPVSLAELMKQADIALYNSKASGRNRYSFYQ